MAARSRKSCEATLARADGVVWSRNFLTTPPRPLHQRRLRCFFLMSRPPLLLLRRGVLEPVPRLGLRSNLIRNLDTCAVPEIDSKLLLIRRRRSAGRTGGSTGAAAGRTCCASSTPRATALSAPEIRLQQMRQRVHVAQLAVFHAEEMSIGRTAAAVCVSGAEGAERHHRTDRRVHHEAAVGDVHTTRDADIAAVIGGALPVCAPPSVRLQG